MEKIVVGTYEEDIKQFEVFCYCLNKNWTGNKHIAVFVGSHNGMPGDVNEVTCIVDRYLKDWDRTVVDGGQPDASDGYAEQNINKIINSFGTPTSIVFDSKDFVLRPLGYEDFIIDNTLALSYFNTSQTHYDLYPDSRQIADNLDIPTTLNLTPWIWDTVILKEMWDKHRHGFYNNDYTEWDSYLTYAYGKIEFPPFEERVIIAGGWTHQTYDGMLEQAKDMKEYAHKKIWKHSRKLEDSRTVEVTCDVLEYFGIPRSIQTILL
jgi:hypothetical protein